MNALRALCLCSMVMCLSTFSVGLWLLEFHADGSAIQGDVGIRAPVHGPGGFSVAQEKFLGKREPEGDRGATSRPKTDDRNVLGASPVPLPSRLPPTPSRPPRVSPVSDRTVETPDNNVATDVKRPFPRNWRLVRDGKGYWNDGEPLMDPKSYSSAGKVEGGKWWTPRLASEDGDLPMQGDGACWWSFDFGMLERWAQPSSTDVACDPAGGISSAGGIGFRAPPSSMICRHTTLDGVPAPTRPHVVCDVSEFVLDFSRTSPSKCPRHRPGYLCDGPPFYQAYGSGFLKGACEATAGLTLTHFPKDHLRDIFGSVTPVDPSANVAQLAGERARTAWGCADGPLVDVGSLVAGGGCEATVPKTVLLLTRERGEFANLFHVMTDFLNAFFALHVAGVIQGEGIGDRKGIEDVGVILLDEQPQGPFDEAWRSVFAPYYGVRRPSSFREAADGGNLRGAAFQAAHHQARMDEGNGRHVSADSKPGVGQLDVLADGAKPRAAELFAEHAVFSPPGYSNILLADLQRGSRCETRTRLFRAFREFFLGGMGIPTPAAREGERLRVVIISRRPYDKFVGHKFIGRQIDNEAELVQALQQDGVFGAQGADVQLVDFVHLDFAEQLSLIAGTDVLIGMHGAALTYGALLPPWAGMLELWPKTTDMWRCFEHLAHVTVASYKRWANSVPSHFRKDKNGDYTTIDLNAVTNLAREISITVRAERSRLLS